MKEGRPARRAGRRLRACLSIAAAIGAACLWAGPTTATPDGRILIDGPDSSSHLKLTTIGDTLLVHGLMSHGGTSGCRFDRLTLAICPLAGISSVEVDMGPSDDKVEVMDRLPVPLTTFLGKGSDKLIGNGERDTCFPGGTRRNRCIGGPGNDVCITGPRNSDCVGGAGDDYCKASTGSDGCWGGPGNDVCYMGPGQDGCHGDAGSDRLYGGADPDQLYGGSGNDYCDGGPGRGQSHECEAGPRH
jgi:hypothetical protein